jgi:hypothetical protein
VEAAEETFSKLRLVDFRNDAAAATAAVDDDDDV